jgi:hypothetical protein
MPYFSVLLEEFVIKLELQAYCEAWRELTVRTSSCWLTTVSIIALLLAVTIVAANVMDLAHVLSMDDATFSMALAFIFPTLVCFEQALLAGGQARSDSKS